MGIYEVSIDKVITISAKNKEEAKKQLLKSITEEDIDYCIETYMPTCKYGYSDCILDPAYKKFNYPDSTSDSEYCCCKDCDDGSEYDDEDK